MKPLGRVLCGDQHAFSAEMLTADDSTENGCKVGKLSSTRMQSAALAIGFLGVLTEG